MEEGGCGGEWCGERGRGGRGEEAGGLEEEGRGARLPGTAIVSVHPRGRGRGEGVKRPCELAREEEKKKKNRERSIYVLLCMHSFLPTFWHTYIDITMHTYILSCIHALVHIYNYKRKSEGGERKRQEGRAIGREQAIIGACEGKSAP